MSKFNATKRPAQPDTVTYEGGAAFTKNLEDDWANSLFSSYLEDGFYESREKRMERYIGLTRAMIEKYGPAFVARAAEFSRNRLGMRSISQLTAALVNPFYFMGKRDFYRNCMHRPDDVSEIFSILDSLGEKPSHALVRGAGDYLSSIDGYLLDKYRMTNKAWSMFDLINVTHAHSSAIDKMKDGTLNKADTWEQKISGSNSKEEKEENWRKLVEGGKLGYLALIRNLNNILDCEFCSHDWLSEYLYSQITNSVAIKKSLVFPYQIYCAYKNLKQRPLALVNALDTAFRMAIGNVPNLSGTSCVILDVSGSMFTPISSHSDMLIVEVGAVYATMIYLSNKDSTFIKFGTFAKECQYGRLDNVFDLIQKMQDNDGCGYCTDIIPAISGLYKHYDRIFIISDMQVMGDSSWGNTGSPYNTLRTYQRKYGRTTLYSFDLGNYSSQIENPACGNLFYMTALNDSVFKVLEFFEMGGKNLVDYINTHYVDVV